MLSSTAASQRRLASVRRRAVCRASTSKVTTTPPPRNMTISVICFGVRDRDGPEKTRTNKKITAGRVVASRPGPRPPYQALTSTARKKSKPRPSPMTGMRIKLIAARTATTATAWRRMVRIGLLTAEPPRLPQSAQSRAGPERTIGDRLAPVKGQAVGHPIGALRRVRATHLSSLLQSMERCVYFM
jgi:hypothetical protein